MAFTGQLTILDDIFTIDNPEFAEHIPDMYPRELQLNNGEFCVRVLVTLQYTHIISRQLLIAADNVMDIYCD